MDKYRRFQVEMTALVVELNRSSGKAEKGMVPVDARLLNEAVRQASQARHTMNNVLEFRLQQAVKDLQKRYKLEERSLDPEPVPEEPKKEIAT